MKFISCLAFTLSLASTACTQGLFGAKPGEPVSFSLLADTESVAPGTSATIGLKFNLDDKWHIYWINPGEMGLPTTVTLSSSSPGVTFGPVRYPAPMTFISPGDLVSYGYAHETMLLCDVQVPQSARGPMEITANGKWLRCRENCVQGKGEAKLQLQVGQPKPKNTELFEKYRSLIPRRYSGPMVKATAVAGATSLTLSITATPETPLVVAEDKERYRALTFYPMPLKGLKFSPVPVPSNTATVTGVKCRPSPAELRYDITGNASQFPASVGGVLVMQPATNEKILEPQYLEIEIR